MENEIWIFWQNSGWNALQFLNNSNQLWLSWNFYSRSTIVIHCSCKNFRIFRACLVHQKIWKLLLPGCSSNCVFDVACRLWWWCCLLLYSCLLLVKLKQGRMHVMESGVVCRFIFLQCYTAGVVCRFICVMNVCILPELCAGSSVMNMFVSCRSCVPVLLWTL